MEVVEKGSEVESESLTGQPSSTEISTSSSTSKSGSSSSGESDENKRKEEKINISLDHVFKTIKNTATGSKDGMIDIDADNCFNYLKENNFNKESMENIVLHSNFDKYLFYNTIKLEKPYVVSSDMFKNNLIYLYHFIFESIFKKYKNENNINVDTFINNAFDVLKNKLKTLKNNMYNKKTKKFIYTDENNNEYQIENNMFDDLITIVEDSKNELLKQEDAATLITTKDLLNYKDNETLITETIDKNLNKYTTDEEKKQVLQNTINLIKKQKIQLQRDKEKLQKAATLMLLLEVYNVNINKLNSVNEVYQMLNKTIKKKVKKINLTKENVDLSGAINAINNVLSKKGKSQLPSGNPITF